MKTVEEKATVARKAFLASAGLKTDDKNKALSAIANALNQKRREVTEANKRDVEEAMNAETGLKLSDAMLARLKLSDEKIDGMIESVEAVAGLPDPAGRTLEARELDKDLTLYKVSTPIGVVGFIFESRPDAVPQ